MNSGLISEKLYSVGRVVVDKSFHTQSGDEAFFTFFGNDVTYSIRRTIDDEDYMEACQFNHAASGNNIYNFLNVNSVFNIYTNIVISIN